MSTQNVLILIVMPYYPKPRNNTMHLSCWEDKQWVYPLCCPVPHCCDKYPYLTEIILNKESFILAHGFEVLVPVGLVLLFPGSREPGHHDEEVMEQQNWSYHRVHVEEGRYPPRLSCLSDLCSLSKISRAFSGIAPTTGD